MRLPRPPRSRFSRFGSRRTIACGEPAMDEHYPPILVGAGADVSAVAPSTPLHEYTRRYPGVFLGPVSQLAPGALPLVKIRTPVYHAFVYGMLIAWLALVAGLGAGLHALALLSGFTISACY